MGLNLLVVHILAMFREVIWYLGDSMSKQGEKRSTSKNNIFMKKYEKIYGTYMVLALFSINLVFWDRFDFFLLNSQKRPIFKK